MVAPVSSPAPKYRLYAQLDQRDCRDHATDIAGRMEERLRRNPHYRYAVDAKQLEPLDVRILECDGWQLYERNCIQRGQRAGDIKPVALDRWEGWQEAFERADATDNTACGKSGPR
jgi:hypothetical protein